MSFNEIIKENKIYKNILNLFVLVLGVLIFKNAFAIDNCSSAEINFNNQIYIIFKNIKSLDNCIKPASKYRLKSCIKRKQEGSKGVNCFPELSKAFNSNKKKDCKVRFHNMERLLKNLVSLEENNPICQKIEEK
mgnify:CR=1 FL=1